MALSQTLPNIYHKPNTSSNSYVNELNQLNYNLRIIPKVLLVQSPFFLHFSWLNDVKGPDFHQISRSQPPAPGPLFYCDNVKENCLGLMGRWEVAAWMALSCGKVSRFPTISGWWFGCHFFFIFPLILGLSHHPN